MKRHRSTRGGKTPPQSTSRSFDRSASRSYSPSMKLKYPSPTNQPHTVKLLTNAYSLVSSKGLSDIYEYELFIEPAIGCKDIPAHVLARNYVTRSIRKVLMEELVPGLIDQNISTNSIIIETKLTAIYSTKEFKLDHSTGPLTQGSLSESEICFNNVWLNNDLFNQLQVDIVIRYKRTFRLDSGEKNFTFLTSILHHQPLLHMMKYGSVYYKSHNQFREHGDRYDLISEHIMGISISGLRHSADGQNLVIINCPHSYITRSHRLIDLLAAFIASQPVPEIQLLLDADDSTIRLHQIPEISNMDGSEDWFSTFCFLLGGYKCKAIAPEDNSCLRFSLTDGPATSLRMNDSATVQEYYRQLNINLNYPNLPCLKSMSNRHPYYPFELCVLLPDQKVPIFRLSSKARDNLSKLNKPRPEDSKKSSSEARDELEAMNRCQFTNYGVHLSKNPVEAEGAILNKPTLMYQNDGFEPRQDFWESGVFYQAMHLVGNWCVVNTVLIDHERENDFFFQFSNYSQRFGFNLGRPYIIDKLKQEILEQSDSIEVLTDECQRLTGGNLKFIMFVIDSSSTHLNRLIHLTFDEQPIVTATCIRKDSIMNLRQHRAIFRTLVHKLNARLGGTNVIFNDCTFSGLSLCCDDLMIIGLDVTHPDNELSGVSIVGCAYTYGRDLFKHRSLVWPQGARVEIISRMDVLMERLLSEYCSENKGCLPKQIIIYRDGVSHEEFERVRNTEIQKAQSILDRVSNEAVQPKPVLSYIIAQKRHTMRFFQVAPNENIYNPPSGTLIDQDIVTQNGREFYLYSNTNRQATARPLHYHILLNGLGVENLQKLTYFLCFNFGKCSGTLSMPSSLKYAHNAAYDARNRVIAAREFNENKFYVKFDSTFKFDYEARPIMADTSDSFR